MYVKYYDLYVLFCLISVPNDSKNVISLHRIISWSPSTQAYIHTKVYIWKIITNMYLMLDQWVIYKSTYL